MKNSLGILFFILDILIFVGFLSIIAGWITWIWCGWFYGWRVLLSAMIAIIGGVGLKLAYQHFYNIRLIDAKFSSQANT